MHNSARALPRFVGAGCQRALNNITERVGHCKRFSSLISLPVKVEAVAERTCQTYGQGVKWHEQQRHVLYIDSKAGYIHRWNAETNESDKHMFHDRTTMFLPVDKDKYIVSIGPRLCKFEWMGRRITPLVTVDETKRIRLRDGSCDAFGRIWFGTSHAANAAADAPTKGALLCLEPDGALRKQADGVNVSGRVAWSFDHKTMFYVDPVARQIAAYDFDIDLGKICHRRVLVDLAGKNSLSRWGYPTDIAVDSDGNLWVTCCMTGRIVKFDTCTGTELNSVSIPSLRSTSLCFGGDHMDEIFVTTSRLGASDKELEQFPLSGSLFRVTGHGTRGLLENRAPAF
ncbi:regucalcin-like [Dreissena polymorpha]|uniref:SMP-30/Gluconolactonase/LRE-like region domain-containing protein n=1 Tax=Dreissena polymorpha TaxID=45954 RepID=A0A9D4GI07_DREPO|nr:regucalcin-like [Dreissena polymorpha]KAH3815758.1 hypothetical protein DPMN_144289 [Dreissena polymorpha]